jgi:putative tryptophan/tyrosine transport system substrate-binding protein
MNKAIAALVVAVVVLYTIVLADAQQPKKIPRIGYLTGATAGGQAARIEAFRQGLREVGYVEGKTFSLSIDMQREASIASPRSRPS